MAGFKTSRMTRILMVCLMASVASGVANNVHAQEQGELMKNMLGKLGLIPEDREPIHYRERAPLVLPPKTGKLPTPVASGYGERKMSNWPKDPDAEAARERAAAANTPRTQTEEWIINQGSTRVSPEQLKATRSAGRDPNDRTPVNVQVSGRAAWGWVNPDELRATGSTYNDSTSSGGGDSRQTLTDPPVGYRKAAGGGKIKPSYDATDRVDPSSPYYVERMRRKQAQEE